MYIRPASAIAKGKREGKEEGLREGEELGLRRGEDRLLKLIQCLTDNNQAELIPKITTDSAYREELYKKYGL